MQKFTKASADKYIKSPSDSQVAKLGHLNEIVENVIPYKIYVAYISQDGTNDPVATVFENTIGNVNIIRISVGRYEITSTNVEFLQNNTFITGGVPGNIGTSVVVPFSDLSAITGYCQIYLNPSAGKPVIYIDIMDDLFNLVELSSLMVKLPVEIKVYN